MHTGIDIYARKRAKTNPYKNTNQSLPTFRRKLQPASAAIPVKFLF
jgi:hypothetical protein